MSGVPWYVRPGPSNRFRNGFFTPVRLERRRVEDAVAEASH
jgi:hypothetical protein